MPDHNQNRRINGTKIAATGHASAVGKAYPKQVREQVISMSQSGGMKALNATHLVPLRYQKKFLCLKTCYRYVRQFQQEGNVLPKRPTGNDYSKREIHGQDLINLALY